MTVRISCKVVQKSWSDYLLVWLFKGNQKERMSEFDSNGEDFLRILIQGGKGYETQSTTQSPSSIVPSWRRDNGECHLGPDKRKSWKE